MCNYCCASSECKECCIRTHDTDGSEIKCNGKCSECSCKDCGEDKQ